MATTHSTAALALPTSPAKWLGAAALLQLVLPWVLARSARRAPELDSVDCHAHAEH